MTKEKAFKKIRDFVISNKGVFLLFCTGIILRLKEYVLNRSLWLDEAYVALGVSRQSFSDILGTKRFAVDLPLPPVGFLLLEKIMIFLFGNNEYSLRFFPFLCGVASLFLFFALIEKVFPRRYIFFPLALFVFSSLMIQYSAEVKHYTAESLFCLLCYILIPLVYQREKEKTKLTMIILAGWVALMFSYSIVFILFSIVCGICLEAALCKNLHLLKKSLFLGLFWAGMFAFQYWQILKPMATNARLTQGAVEHGYLLSSPVFSFETAQWLLGKFLDLFQDVTRGPLAYVPAFLFLVGTGVLVRQQPRNIAFFLPFVCVFGAALMGKYPIGHRFFLFLIPLVYLLMSVGLLFIVKAICLGRRRMAILVMGLFLFFPAHKAFSRFLAAKEREATRPVLSYWCEHFQSKDALFMNSAAKYAFGYYHGYFNQSPRPLLVGEFLCSHEQEPARVYYDTKYYMFDGSGFLNGEATKQSSREALRNDLKWFNRNARSWVFFVHVSKECENRTLNVLNEQGKMINSYIREGAALYLYDFSEKVKN